MGIELAATNDDLKRKFYAIVSVSDVADLLEVTNDLLMYILYKKGLKNQYRMFSIMKKSGGTRQILSPTSSLKLLQSKLSQILSIVYQAKPCVHGYTQGRSIVSNARMHVRRKWVYNVDLNDFFPSINFGRVRGMFIKYFNLPEEPATVLAQICCYENQLPQGAPTSPIISNLIFPTNATLL